jgi:hypothetical protein
LIFLGKEASQVFYDLIGIFFNSGFCFYESPRGVDSDCHKQQKKNSWLRKYCVFPSGFAGE